jgi:hypothetical protein
MRGRRMIIVSGVVLFILAVIGFFVMTLLPGLRAVMDAH